MNRALQAGYKVVQAVPLVAVLLGLPGHEMKLLLGLDFLAGVGLAAYLDLPAPAPPAPIATNSTSESQ